MTILRSTLRDFLEYRATHRPDEAFGPKDGRMPGSKFRRCHLVHGKAILIYQLHGSEIRLVTIDEHNAVEGSTNRLMLSYIKSLQPDDYYTFDVNDPVPTKPWTPPMSDQPIPAPEPLAQPVPEPISDEVHATPHSNGVNPLWNDKLIQFVRGRQLLYVPRPQQPVIPFILEREVIAPRGDVLIFNPTALTVHHLSRAEFEASYQPHARHTTDLGEAFAVAMEPTATVSPTPTPVEPDPAPDLVGVVDTIAPTEPNPLPRQPIRRPARKNDIGAQTGRMMAVMAFIQQSTRSNKIDAATMKIYLQERDVAGLSTTLFNAQRAQPPLVKKVGPVPGSGRAYYYCLTPTGEKQVKALGNWPFEAVGQRVPFEKHQPAVAA